MIRRSNTARQSAPRQGTPRTVVPTQQRVRRIHIIRICHLRCLHRLLCERADSIIAVWIDERPHGMADSKTDPKTGTKKRSFRGGKARSLGQHVGWLTKRAFGQRGFADGAVVAQWPTIVGEHLSDLSAPERISFPRGKRAGGTLYLRIASGSIAVELQHLEPVLIERINSHFGYKAVERIRMHQAPLPPKVSQTGRAARAELSAEQTESITKSLDGVDDPDLHDALERLARAVMGRKAT